MAILRQFIHQCIVGVCVNWVENAFHTLQGQRRWVEINVIPKTSRLAHHGRASRANKSTFHTLLGLVCAAREPFNLTRAGRLLRDYCGSDCNVTAEGQSRDRRAAGRLAEAAGQKQAQVDLQSTTRALKPPVYLSQSYGNVRSSLCANAGWRLTHSCKNAPHRTVNFALVCWKGRAIG